MSDYAAVAGVSAILKYLLYQTLGNYGPSQILAQKSGISAIAPDLINTGPDEQTRLNLFMYHASINAAYRNRGLPAFDSSGQRLRNPPLALDLHYLVSAYGAKDFDAEMLLAWAMQVFHENPVITQDYVQQLVTGISTSGMEPDGESQILGATTLASQIESIRITPEAITNDDISKLWMAFQTHYRPTAAYLATVVIIQSTSEVKSNLPVQKRNVLVTPWQPPTISSVAPATIATGQTLTIRGQNFIGDTPSGTMVQFDNDPPVSPVVLQGKVLTVVVPPDLQAGVHAIKVLRNVQFNGGPAHPGFSSNSAQFQLLPTISPPVPASVAVGGTLMLNITPAVGRNQNVALLIGDASIPFPARFPTDPLSAATLNFTIPSTFAPTAPDSQPLRVQVSGAQSPLTVDQSPGSATAGQFLPQVEVTA